jgi:hypothetical protein
MLLDLAGTELAGRVRSPLSLAGVGEVVTAATL